jgi:hypothetical protein
MKRPSKPNLEERAIKEETARPIRSFQHGEHSTEQDIIKPSPKVQRILEKYFTCRNNMSGINNYCIRGSNFYKYDSNNEDNHDTILYSDDEEPSKRSVEAYPIFIKDCWKCPGYLVNHFTEAKTSCLCQCHHNNHKKSRTRHRPSITGITYSSFAECTGGNTTEMITCYTAAITRRRSCPGWKGRIGHNDNFTNYN